MKSAEVTSVGPVTQLIAVGADRASSVVAFPGMGQFFASGLVHRFTMRDRITVLDWAASAQCLGLTRVVFEAAEDLGDSETGEFLLIYPAGGAWASWGIACGERGLTLWHSARGTTIGLFDTMGEALNRIQLLCARG